MKTKWKVDDWVGIKGSDLKFHIIEVLHQTCYGGEQVHYTGRTFIKKDFGKGYIAATAQSKFVEIELEDLPVEKESK